MNDKRSYISADYYQNLHDTNQAFMENNWLLNELDLIRGIAGDVNSLLELGCGNGRFLEQAANVWPEVTGVDWAKSAYLNKLQTIYKNIRFIQADISTFKFQQKYDLIVSADFLEHLPKELLGVVIAEALRAGLVNFHKIACYDDGHSHLSILTPDEWLAIFNAQPGGESIRIVHSEFRKGNPSNIVVSLSNGLIVHSLE